MNVVSPKKFFFTTKVVDCFVSVARPTVGSEGAEDGMGGASSKRANPVNLKSITRRKALRRAVMPIVEQLENRPGAWNWYGHILPWDILFEARN